LRKGKGNFLQNDEFHIDVKFQFHCIKLKKYFERGRNCAKKKNQREQLVYLSENNILCIKVNSVLSQDFALFSSFFVSTWDSTSVEERSCIDQQS